MAAAPSNLPSWRECAERAALSSRTPPSLTPPVRHTAVDGTASLRGLTPKTAHIATTRARIASLAGPACPGTHQPTLVFTTVGGFGDRLRGMVTTFYAALLTHAQFRVSWNVPSPVAPYFDIDPALLWEDGQTPLESTNEDPHSSARRVVDVIDVYAFFTDPASDFVAGLAPLANGTVTILRTNAPSWLEVVRHPSLRKAADLYGLTDLSRRDLFVLALQAVLRRPAAAVIDAAVMPLPQTLQAPVRRSLARGFVSVGQDGGVWRGAPPGTFKTFRPDRRGFGAAMGHVGDHAATVTNPTLSPLALIGVQIRTGGVGEAWTDSDHRHPVDAARCFADRAREVCEGVYGGACAVFLTADSRAAAAVFVSAFNGSGIAIAQTEGPILHTDRGVPVTSGKDTTSTTSSDPWLKTYADWAALTQADVLLMSHSGYGLTAAWAGGVSHVWQLRKGEEGCAWVRLDDCGEVPI